MGEVNPITKANPTIKDVMGAVTQAHHCLEGARTEIRALGVGVDDLRDRVARIEGAQEAMARGFGLPTPAQMADAGGEPGLPKVTRKWASVERWQAVGTMIGATGGGLLLFKVVAGVAPGVIHTLLTITP